MHYIPNTKEIEKEILKSIGVSKFEDLLTSIPREIVESCKINLPEPLSELEVSKLLEGIAAKNKHVDSAISFLGGGIYDHFVPTVVDFLISRSEFYTAYTPYQPEVSQGTLQSIYEYQSLICQLMDMEVANASLYDGATAIAEAAIMSLNISRKNKILVSPLLNPNYLNVLKTYMDSRSIEIGFLSEGRGITDFSDLADKLDNTVSSVIVQSPNFLGNIENVSGISDILHDRKILLVMSIDPISLSILKSPGELGADIAVAEGQSLGIHQSFGGPYLGIFATKKSLIRSLPGRLVGETVDTEGNRGYVLVLQTREQHIRREKATSNICTNEALMALSSAIYLCLMGKKGLKKAASLCLNNSHYLANKISELPGYRLPFNDVPFFKEFCIETPVKASDIVESGIKEGFFAGLDLGKYRDEWKNYLLIAVTEKRSKQEIDDFLKFLSKF